MSETHAKGEVSNIEEQAEKKLNTAENIPFGEIDGIEATVRLDTDNRDYILVLFENGDSALVEHVWEGYIIKEYGSFELVPQAVKTGDADVDDAIDGYTEWLANEFYHTNTLWAVRFDHGDTLTIETELGAVGIVIRDSDFESDNRFWYNEFEEKYGEEVTNNMNKFKVRFQ